MPRAASCDAEVIGLREVARRARCGTLVEPSLLLGIGRRLAIARDEREHAEHVVHLREQVLQRALCPRR